MNENLVLRAALEVARGPKVGAPQAHFGVIRQYCSLNFATLGVATPVKASIEKIEFDLNRRTPQAGAPGEICLAEADGFIATHIRFSIIKRTAAQLLDQCRAHYFANPLVFTGTLEATKLNAIYGGGKLKIRAAGNDWNKEGLSMKAFERSSMFNQGMQIVADTPDASLPVSAVDGLFDGAVPLVPGFLFGGRKGNTAVIELAQSTAMVDSTAADTENIACLEIIGIYCPNVAAVLDGEFLPV